MRKDRPHSKSHELVFGGVPEHFNLPWRLAVKDGAFSDLPVIWEEQYGGTGQMVQKLAEGDLDVAVLLTEGLIKAVTHHGVPAKMARMYISSPLLWGIHTGAHRDELDSPNALAKDARFAISRLGSGSHLMAYILAKKLGFTLDESRFVVVGNLEGARSAIKENRAEVLLWDRFMLAGLVEKKELKRLGEVPTPWPSFAVAVRNDVYKRKRALVDLTLDRLFEIASTLKTRRGVSTFAVKSYGLLKRDTAEWLKTTAWVNGVYPEKEMVVDVIAQLKDAHVLDDALTPTAYFFER